MNLKKLYQQVLLDHNKNPRNFKVIENPTHYAHGVNPLCGDDYHLFITLDEDTQVITDIGFHGSGCAISKSVSSMMTMHVLNKTLNDVLDAKNAFIELLTEELATVDTKILGNLTLFENVKDFPIRVKCATLIWRALEAALTKKEAKITTEE